MGLLPKLKYSDSLTQTVQVNFGGLRHHKNCADGELYDMANLTARDYPVMSTRDLRSYTERRSTVPAVSIFMKNGNLVWTESDGTVLLKATDNDSLYEVASAEPGKAAELVRFGDRVVLFPAMQLLNMTYPIKKVITSTNELPTNAKIDDAYIVEEQQGAGNGDLYVYDGASWVKNGKFNEPLATTMTVEGVQAKDGTLYGKEAKANTLVIPLQDVVVTDTLRFKVGDAVTITGMAIKENNKTAVIREIHSGDEDNTTELRFSENAFTLESSGTEPVTIARVVPEFDFIFEHGNRLWGAKGKTIAASALGDPTNWNVFEGLSTDSWELRTQEPGAITAGISFQGYATFFREDGRTVVYGDEPASFGVSFSMMPGVEAGARRSLGIAGGTLFYLNKGGMYAYDGGEYPASLSQVFGEGDIEGGLATYDGGRYYVQLKVDGVWGLYVMDAAKGIWMRETILGAETVTDMTYDGKDLYAMTVERETESIYLHKTWKLHGEQTGTMEPDLYAFAEFGDFTDGSPMKKAVNRLLLRMDLKENAEVTVYIQYDSSGIWEPVRRLEPGNRKMTYQLHITPRRADHYRLKVEGWGQWSIFSLAKQYYIGSER